MHNAPPKMTQVTFTLEPVKDKRFDEVSEEDQVTISRLYHHLRFNSHLIKSEKDEYFQTLHQLREKYKNLPSIWNYITMGYEALGLEDKVRELIFETYANFPRYLFAMTGVANLYLEEEMSEKVSEIFGDAKSLPKIYPNRSVFHVTEGRAFHHTMAWYFCAKGELDIAKNQLKILEMISEMMELRKDPFVKRIRLKVKKLERGF